MSEHPNLYSSEEYFRKRLNDSAPNSDSEGSQKRSQAKSKSNYSDASVETPDPLSHQHSRSEANSPNQIHKSSAARKARYSEAVKKKKELK
jgi:hypothetical protein